MKFVPFQWIIQIVMTYIYIRIIHILQNSRFNHGCSSCTFWLSMGLYRWTTHNTPKRNATYVNIHFKPKKIKTIFLFLPEKYPQIKQLMGHDWRIAVQVIITVLIQIIMAVLVRDLPWKFVWLFTYVFSGTLNHSLSISFHESMKQKRTQIKFIIIPFSFSRS